MSVLVASPRAMQRAVYQDPRGLAYAAFVGDAAERFDLRALSILQRASLVLERVIVDAAIIGESHFVRVTDRGGRALAVELLACIDPDSCGGAPSFVGRYGDGPIELDVRGSISIRARVHTRHRRDDAVALPPAIVGEHSLVLAHSFPGALAPRTAIALRADRRGTQVRVDTIHEYATTDAFVVVASDTVFGLPEAA